MARWERVRSRSPRPTPAPWDDAPPDHGPETPFVLAVDGQHGPVIHAVSTAAADLGITTGTRVVDVRALCPDLVALPADLAGDAAALGRLTLWARRWCPWSASDGADGIVLDTTGSSHLWGGEAGMLTDMSARLGDLGQETRLAVAPTHGAAWALAHYGGTQEISHPDALRARLAALPVAALRLDGATLLTLRRLGLKRIGDLMAIPRATLNRRFGRDGKTLMTPLRRLDQALGHLPEPVVSAAPPRRYRQVQRLAEPILDPQPSLPGLMQMLCQDMARDGQGARAIRLDLYHVDGRVTGFEALTARASRDPAHLYRLMERRFETLDAGFGFDTIAVEATRIEHQSSAQARLDGGDDADVATATLIDRLSSRLGPQAVQCPAPRESHIPERAETWKPALRGGRADLLAPGGLGGGGMVAPARDRPVRLLQTPERIEVLYAVPEGPPVRFKWRRKPYLIRRHQGPERLSPEWWRAAASARLRDYYKVEVTDGARYWLFREGIAGDGRGADPDWFLHGLFA